MASDPEERLDLRKKLLRKLKGGNKRYPHLNSTIGKARGKIDLLSLRGMGQDLPEQFLEQLLTRNKMMFEISFKGINSEILQYTNKVKSKKLLDESEQKALDVEKQRIQASAELKKKLDVLAATQKEEFDELGTKSFAFGFPLLVKQVGAEKDDVICAPLFIWYLDITRDYREDNVVVSRSSEENPIVFNEMLDYFLGNELQIELDEVIERINSVMLDDGLLEVDELNKSIAEVARKISPSLKYEYSNSYDNCPKDRSSVASQLDTRGKADYVLNAGMFGIYRAGKQSIISDIKKLISMEDYRPVENESEGLQGRHIYSAIKLDPTQYEVISGLESSENIIIQGPPGTGKSQTLSALVTNALSNRRRTLVVCEKRTAMEVIKKNLFNDGLGDYVGVIENVSRDRSVIVDKAREIRDSRYDDYTTKSFYEEFNSSVNGYESAAKIVDEHHAAIANTAQANLGDNKAILGKLISSRNLLAGTMPDGAMENLKKNFSTIPFEYNKAEFDSILEQVESCSAEYKIISTPLCEIPYDKIVGSDFESDRSALHDSLTRLSDAITDINRSVESERRSLISEIESAAQEIHTEMIDVAKKALPLANVKQDSFDWDELVKHVLSVKPRDPRICKKIGSLVALNNKEKDDLTKINSIYQTKINEVEEAIRRYGDDLNTIIEYLRALGASNLRVELKDRIASPFSAKRKSMNRIRTQLAELIIRANNTKELYTEILNTTELGLDSELGERASMELKELPINEDIVKFVGEQKLSAYTSDFFESEINSIPLADIPLKISAIQLKNFKFADADIMKYFKSELSRLKSELPEEVMEIDTKKLTNDSDELTTIANSELDIKKLHEVAEVNANSTSSTVRLSEIKTEIIRVLSDDANKVLANTIHEIEEANTLADLTDCIVGKQRLLQMGINEIDSEDFYSYYRWVRSYLEMSDVLKGVIDSLGGFENGGLWKDLFATLYYEAAFKRSDTSEIMYNDLVMDRLMKNNKKIRKLLVKTIEKEWSAERRVRIDSFESHGLRLNSLYNKRGSAGQRRNSLRRIVEKDFRLFTSLFPVVICNPGSAASLFKLEKDLFDVVLFDEASQLRLEDTYTSLYRGKTKIISGDEHQMPPSNYFHSSVFEDEQEYEEDENIQAAASAEAESLLDYAVSEAYRKSMLCIHYRSEHQDLIEFSNRAFYEGKLAPIMSLGEYKPIEFHEVNGRYGNRTNRDEALRVIAWLKSNAEAERNRSIGVATLNLPQSELIKDEVSNARLNDAVFNETMINLEANGFFVKNLENIQGDERDIILLSTTFGLNDNGKFLQNLGPVGRKLGYRLLNVLVTRAKHKFIVFSSIPVEKYSRYEEELNLLGKDGRAIFYAYLAYARAVSQGEEENKKHILDVLGGSSVENQSILENGMTESPFEEEVLNAIEDEIGSDRIVLQYNVGTEKFRIDMVILTKDRTRPMLAIECDGYAYHSSPRAHLYDLYREEILEQKGFIFHRIWSTNWFHDSQNEKRKLIEKIKELDRNK